MNCRDFESRMDELARDPVADARAEESAHAEGCARCAARLADELALTEGLRALRSKSEAAEAPARVESALLAALRARAATFASVEGAGLAQVGNTQDEVGGGASTRAGYDNVSTLAERRGARRWSWAKTVAVATLAAAAALTLFMLIPPGLSVPAPRKADEVAQTPGPDDAGKDEATSKPQDSAGGIEDGAGEQTTLAELAGLRAKSPRVNVAPRQPVRAFATPAAYNAGAARGGSHTGRGVAEDAGAEEIATDFFPLMQGGRFAQGEGGTLVRVELPRSALASFGLPVNAEAAGGRVKADVLLGEDGLARAIRFVR